MNKSLFCRRAACCLIVVILTVVGDCPAQVQGSETPQIAQILDEVGIKPRLGQQVPVDATFVDDQGRTVRFGELLRDRPVILHLVYYQCPMLCQLSNDGLLRALGMLKFKPGTEFDVVTVSFDPREGPELSARAKELAKQRIDPSAVEEGWSFLTGDVASIGALTEAVGFRSRFDAASGQYAHASGIFVLTPTGKVSRYLTGVEYSPRDLRLSLVEASQDKIGTTGDQVMLLCYMYDPVTGRYGLAILTVLRALALATVFGLGIAITLMLRGERSRSSENDESQPRTDSQET